MPNKYEVTEESIARRKTIMALCQDEPKTMKEMAYIMDKCPNALRHSVMELIKNGHLKVAGTKPDENKRECFAYLCTDSKYMPHVAAVIPQTVKANAPQIEIKVDQFKPVIIQETPHKRTVYLTNNVKTRGNKIKRDGWIGSTMSTMSF
jgi:hypothetical protein